MANNAKGGGQADKSKARNDDQKHDGRHDSTLSSPLLPTISTDNQPVGAGQQQQPPPSTTDNKQDGSPSSTVKPPPADGSAASQFGLTKEEAGKASAAHESGPPSQIGSEAGPQSQKHPAATAASSEPRDVRHARTLSDKATQTDPLPQLENPTVAKAAPGGGRQHGPDPGLGGPRHGIKSQLHPEPLGARGSGVRSGHVARSQQAPPPASSKREPERRREQPSSKKSPQHKHKLHEQAQRTKSVRSTASTKSVQSVKSSKSNKSSKSSASNADAVAPAGKSLLPAPSSVVSSSQSQNLPSSSLSSSPSSSLTLPFVQKQHLEQKHQLPKEQLPPQQDKRQAAGKRINSAKSAENLSNINSTSKKASSLLGKLASGRLLSSSGNVKQRQITSTGKATVAKANSAKQRASKTPTAPSATLSRKSIRSDHSRQSKTSITSSNSGISQDLAIIVFEPQPQLPATTLDSTRQQILSARHSVKHHQKLHQSDNNNNNTDTMADQAVVDKLEAGFAKLQASTPEQCHSLLKKYLTREVLDKNKTKKTAMGATLLDVAQSGFENLDSGVGIYAPDAESYTLFADLFNPIIEDYHGGFKATDKHPQSDFGDINTLVNLDPNNEFVISTRVRCGRSLQGYPFNPCLTEAQYKEMEQKVSSTLKEMSGDLAGTYYPLTGMTKETQQQLIDDHFLFKEGDRFLQAANACRYWPTGRGIYHNAEKTFLVWVNEEDHLRIISMQKGGDLKTIYDRLIRGAKSIESKVPFSRDDRLGFLTFCPTNLGTTIRASVHIKLPKLAADRKKLEEVASRYNLQVRGTSGEHTESVGGVYDISNKRRLGLTEYQAVREMQDGILELIKIEKSL